MPINQKIAQSRVLRITAVASLMVASTAALAADTKQVWPTAPPQDQGMPYTRTGKPRALAAVKDCIALFAGSRYAYVHGYKVRLDEQTPERMLHAEAILRDGHLLVPAAFEGVVRNSTITPQPASDGLDARWVYEYPRAFADKDSLPTVDVDGHPYVDASRLAKHALLTSRGMLLLSSEPITYNDDADRVLSDDIVTLFDTPDKLADPDIATQYIPLLHLQGKWTDHVKHTPEQLKLLDGPETKWETISQDKYDLGGFDVAMLGSAVPPPGVYPRMLFSEQDLPVIFKRMEGSKLGQKTLAEWDVLFHKTWWDPSTSDGQTFLKLAAGDKSLAFPPVREGQPLLTRPVGLFAGQKPGIFVTHVSYVTNCLTTMSLYCLLTGDDAHGRQAAKAIANYYRIVEPQVDDLLAHSDSELGVNPDLANFAETGWRGMHGIVSHMDLPFALDFAGKWMSAQDKEFMRHFITKATYGRRDNMQAAPDRVKDINHLTWHLTDFLAATAIEGLSGCDPELLEAGRESAKAWLDWGIDENGQIFESNGKNGGGLQFEILSLITLARRGDNLWGHPHLRKLTTAQVYATAPDGRATVSSGTWGGSPLTYSGLDMIRAFYPDDRANDLLLTYESGGAMLTGGASPGSAAAMHVLTGGSGSWDLADFDPAAYRAELEKSIAHVRLPGPTYPAFVFSGIYDNDWKPTKRADLKMPPVWNDPVHGELAVSNTDEPDTAWIFLHSRPNQYIGSGHHHADVGMFYFASGGVDWIKGSPFVKTYEGKYKGEVLVDGNAEPDGLPGRGTYLGAAIGDSAAFAAVDQTQSYTYKWTNQIILWHDTGDGNIWDRAAHDQWELSTDPLAIAVYKGTQHYKSRPWWPTYNFSNWLPVCQTLWNPMKYVYRTAGLVRGAHSYGVVVDDLKKDDATHLYQWAVPLNEGVWRTKTDNLPKNASMLAYRAAKEGAKKAVVPQTDIAPQAGEPVLLIWALTPGDTNDATLPLMNVEAATDGPRNETLQPGPASYNRCLINYRGDTAKFKVLLVPIKYGDPMPEVAYDAAANTATVSWKDQIDHLTFKPGDDGRTRLSFDRGKNAVAAVQ